MGLQDTSTLQHIHPPVTHVQKEKSKTTDLCGKHSNEVLTEKCYMPPVYPDEGLFLSSLRLSMK